MNPEYAAAPFDASETDHNNVLVYILNEVRELADNGHRKIIGNDVRTFYQRIREKFSQNTAYAVIATRIFFMLAENARDEFQKRLFRRAASEIAAQTEVNLQADGLRQRIIARTAAPGASHEVVSALTELDPVKCKNLLDDAFRCAVDPCKTDVVKIVKCGEFHQPLLKAAFGQSEREIRIAACSALASAVAAAAVTASATSFAATTSTGTNTTTREKLRADAARCEQAILKASDVCAALPMGTPKFEFTKQRMQVLVDTLNEPAVAAGILQWAAISFQAPRADQLKFVIPKLTALIHLIGERHQRKLLRKKALDVLHRAFLRQWDEQQDIDAVQQCQALFVDALVNSARWWMAEDLAKLINAFYLSDHRIDSSHIRNLVTGILQLIQPPYTPKLADFMIPILYHQRVVSVLSRQGRALRETFLRDTKPIVHQQNHHKNHQNHLHRDV